MEINWSVVGWIIDMILNGAVWLIIAVLSLILIDMTDHGQEKLLNSWIKLIKLLENL